MKTHDVKQTALSYLRKIILILFVLVLSAITVNAHRTISGRIIDSNDGSALVGANICIKGSSIGVLSDMNGIYSIQVNDRKNSILVFSYIGYITQEINLLDADTLNVALVAEIVSLDEVVVMGYAVQKKSEVTGAVCAVQSSFFSRIMSANNSSQSYTPVYVNPSTESYSKIKDNGYKDVNANPLSTFSIDVDKASYSNVRRFINMGSLPPVDAVRIEELVNYFEYDYPQPIDEHPFSINTEYTTCPWQEGHQLLRIGLQGKKIPVDKLPPSNLVFLLDVSGSMGQPNKLPLVKAAFRLLVNNLREKDHVAIVVYAGAAGQVLPSTSGDEKIKILDALNSLEAGGSTAGCEGITLAYKVAKENFIQGGNNRVILATDGDFNVGLSNENELEDFISKKRDDGIYLSCLGFGMGNYKDSKIELLSDKGNGNYAYIDDITEANKVFVNEFGGTLFTIAKDVKIQVEFNPALVQSYRLIGYENRLLNDEDFKDDKKDAGELGSGHTVTALYEIIPVGAESNYVPKVDKLKYQKAESTDNKEIATVKFRYKKPDGFKSIEMIHPIANESIALSAASENTRFAASITMFGMLLSNSEYKGSCTFDEMLDLADNARGKDKEGYRGEFVRLAKTAKSLGLSARNE